MFIYSLSQKKRKEVQEEEEEKDEKEEKWRAQGRLKGRRERGDSSYGGGVLCPVLSGKSIDDISRWAWDSRRPLQAYGTNQGHPWNFPLLFGPALKRGCFMDHSLVMAKRLE